MRTPQTITAATAAILASTALVGAGTGHDETAWLGAAISIATILAMIVIITGACDVFAGSKVRIAVRYTGAAGITGILSGLVALATLPIPKWIIWAFLCTASA